MDDNMVFGWVVIKWIKSLDKPLIVHDCYSTEKQAREVALDLAYKYEGIRENVSYRVFKLKADYIPPNREIVVKEY